MIFVGALTSASSGSVKRLLRPGSLSVQLHWQRHAHEVQIGLQFVEAHQERRHPCVGRVSTSVSVKHNDGPFGGRLQRHNIGFEEWIKLRIQFERCVKILVDVSDFDAVEYPPCPLLGEVFVFF